MSWAEGGAVPTEAEYAAWLAELHAANKTLDDFAVAAEKKREGEIADAAHTVTGIFGGIPLPQEVRDAIAIGKRAASFLDYVPMDDATKALVTPIVSAFVLLARVLGI